MIGIFVDREQEMKLLEREWENVPSFVVVYGRRRIGKTRLLTEFSRGKRAFFHTFMEGAREEQIRILREELAGFFEDEIFLSFSDWFPLFKYLSSRIKERTLIVLDEFSYAVKADRGILSALQRAWDHELSERPVMLVLSGSLLGMMRDEVLSYSSPLYGRRTAGFLLKPINLRYSLNFFKDMDYGIRAYMLLGGIPAYLSLAARKSGIEELMGEFLSPIGYFYDEPYIVLAQELRELKVYFSILSAIAGGRHRPTEIANHVGMEGRRIYPYLETLIRLGFVRRETPVVGKEKRGLYRISDPMLLTWFSIVYPKRTAIELGIITREEVFQALQRVYSLRFEEVSRQFLVEINTAERLSFRFERIGRWWRKNEEIDLVALSERERKAFFVEVKWQELSEREARGILRDLERKSELVGLEDWEEGYGLIAKSVEGKEELKEEGYLIFDLKDFSHYR